MKNIVTSILLDNFYKRTIFVSTNENKMNYNELGSKGIVSNKAIIISTILFAIGLITLFAIALNH